MNDLDILVESERTLMRMLTPFQGEREVLVDTLSRIMRLRPDILNSWIGKRIEEYFIGILAEAAAKSGVAYVADGRLARRPYE